MERLAEETAEIYNMDTANPRPTVVSVDDSDEWIEKTGSYLKGKNVSTDHLIPWDDFAGMSMEPFNLRFLRSRRV